MKYITESVRRHDRVMDEARALELLRTAEFGVLSMVSEGGGYGVPVNFVWDGESAIYVHCAVEGRKINALKENPRVSFCIIGDVDLLPAQFSTDYESVVLFGNARLGLSDDEKHKALQLLLTKLAPDFMESGEKHIVSAFNRVEVIRIDLDEFSGKNRRRMTAAK